MRQALTSSQQRCTSQEAPPWSVSSPCSLFQSMWDKQQLAREFCGNATIVQTCKSRKSPVQRQQRNLPPVHSRQDPGLSLAQPLADTPAGKSPFREPMWLPCWLRKNRHDLCCLQIQEREICWTAPWPLQNIFDLTKAFHIVSRKWFCVQFY